MLLIMPTVVFAATIDEEAASTQVKDLKETVEAIDLAFKGTDYKETDDQVVVYLFRMTTCEHCHDAVSFFNDIVEEYGDKFKLRSFEITGNATNNAIYQRVINYLKIKEGVPLILIGQNQFRGFNSNTGESIKKAIDQTYEEKERFDIFDEIEKKEEENKGTATIIMLSLIGIVVIGCITIFIVKKFVQKK